jgi:hypothetical protein
MKRAIDYDQEISFYQEDILTRRHVCFSINQFWVYIGNLHGILHATKTEKN